jgi:homocysteine S-methyltransferase
MPDFRKAIADRVLIGDGAMGTYLYQLGFPVGISYEELNLLNPEAVADVHRRYYKAGARFIETNTFSANREKLSKYGLEREVEAINRAGVEIARKAVGPDAFVFGAIGSIRAGKRKNVQTSKVKRDLQEQIEALLGAGVDGLILETFYDLEEMMIGLNIARKLTPLPIVCQFATEGSGSTHDGVALEEAFRLVKQAGADVIGFNCRSGPNGILRSMEKVAERADTPFSAFPNAGIPDFVDGRYTYVATPQYFAESAVKFADLGARIIGGCCGTTPDHIAQMAARLSGYAPGGRQNGAGRPDAEPSAEHSGAAAEPPGEAAKAAPVRIVVVSDAKPAASGGGEGAQPEPSLIELVKRRHTVIVELDPPRDLDITKFMQGAAALKNARVDALTMADNSLAMTRMSNMPLGFLVKDRLGLRPLLHIACRDRNLIGTQSHLMGMHALGIDHVLAVTGDPARFGDLPGSSSVYDLTSFEMIRMIKQLNEGIAFSGKPLKQRANFVVGGAFNPHVKQFDKAIQRLERKVEAGVDYIMTQPVFDPALFEKIYTATRHLGVPVFIGIMPLISENNAVFLHNEVPGIQLSDETMKRMAGLRGEEGRAMGVRIAKELLDEAMKYFHGIYLMTQMSFYEMSVELTEYIWNRASRSDFHLSPLSK